MVEWVVIMAKSRIALLGFYKIKKNMTGTNLDGSGVLKCSELQLLAEASQKLRQITAIPHVFSSIFKSHMLYIALL